MRSLLNSCVSIALASFVSACGAAHAHNGGRKGFGAPLEGVVVVGHGKAQGQPDVARINVGVEVRAGTADQAVQDLNTRMAALIASVKQAGVSDKDVRTSNFSISFEQVPEPPPGPLPAPPRAAGGKGALPAPPAEPPVKLPSGYYRASNTVEVTMRDLKRASEVLTAATRAGANQVFGIQFELENPNALQAEANGKAVADARARATKLAQQAGVTLGRVVSISEVIDGGGPMLQKGYGMARDAAMSSVPVERGELTIQSAVQVVYALGERDD
ncbi:MAG TPA: SIMPL domain-containing protein [Polyangiaceae bacterium]|nr:SIMPL domain-containing protein [Polyangiaceae bacterium]